MNNRNMETIKIHRMVLVALMSLILIPVFGQNPVLFEKGRHIIPEGIVEVPSNQSNHLIMNNPLKSVQSKEAISVKYRYGKVEIFTKEGEDDVWDLINTQYYDYNDFGNRIKYCIEGSGYTVDNNYTLYYYDEQNRNIKIERYSRYDGDSHFWMSSYNTIEYLDDFPEIASSDIAYHVRSRSWDNDINDWSYKWVITSGYKRDYTRSNKVADCYEKQVDYVYNTDTQQWEVSGYKYDYVTNPKGLIQEVMVYQATSEDEREWPLILHVKNLINDNGVVFRSDRIDYQSSTPYIERWSGIKWDKHNGLMPISGYPVEGNNRISSAKIEYLLLSDPSSEYAPCQFFSAEYQNGYDFHYIVKDKSGNKLIDNSYTKQNDYSLQEIWDGDFYEMYYKEYDSYYETYYHNVQKQFYEGDNVITLRDWHRYSNFEYYKNTSELQFFEQYEYDALTDTEPHSRTRVVYSDYKEYSGVEGVLSEKSNEEPIYYNLQGCVVQNPLPGQLLIRKLGDKTEKIIYK